MCTYLWKAVAIMKNQRNMIPPKKHKKHSANGPKEMQTWISWQIIQKNFSKDTQRAIIEHR